jgi:hypothetical protein
VEHSVNIDELQRVVRGYVDQYNLVVAAGPLTAASVLKLVTRKNKFASIAMVGGGAWLAVQELSTPMLGLIKDQFGYLQALLGSFRG